MAKMHFDALEHRAIAYYAKAYGLTPQLSIYPKVTFLNKETNNTIDVYVRTIVEEYEKHVKEERREEVRRRSQQLKLESGGRS